MADLYDPFQVAVLKIDYSLCGWQLEHITSCRNMTDPASLPNYKTGSYVQIGAG